MHFNFVSDSHKRHLRVDVTNLINFLMTASAIVTQSVFQPPDVLALYLLPLSCFFAAITSLHIYAKSSFRSYVFFFRMGCTVHQAIPLRVNARLPRYNY